MYKLRVRLLALLVGLIMVLPALAQIAETPKIRLKQVSQVQSTGDVRSTIDLTFSTRLYTQLRSEVNNTSLLLRELGITGHVAEMKDLRAEYDDARHAIKVSGIILGGMKNRGKEWFGEIMEADKYETVHVDGNSIILMGLNQMDNGTIIVGTWRVEFPAGTRNIRFDPGRGGCSARCRPRRLTRAGPLKWTCSFRFGRS
jgi:hypothetical protein